MKETSVKGTSADLAQIRKTTITGDPTAGSPGGRGCSQQVGCLGSWCLLEQIESRQIRDLHASLLGGVVGKLLAPIARILMGPGPY